MVKEGAAVIDVGINRIHDPKTGKVRLIGDVDFEGELISVLPLSLFFHQEKIVQVLNCNYKIYFLFSSVFVVIWLTTYRQLLKRLITQASQWFASNYNSK